MSKLLVCRGIPASGKSTWALAWAKEDPEHRVRFNWDDLRNMMGEYWVASRESCGILKIMRSTFLNEMMEKGYDIVCDNMNLNPKELEYYQHIVDTFNIEHENSYTVEIIDFFTPVEVCIERDSKRINPIGEKVIRDIWKRYKHDIWTREAQQKLDGLKTYNCHKQDCILVDMDNTLAFNTSGRPYYGDGCADGIKYDEPLISTISIVRAQRMTGTCKIFISTGRDESCREATTEWLKEHNVPYDEIFMRDNNDYSSGAEIKEKVLKNLIKDYNILFALDDDPICASMYHQNGVVCLQP